MLERAKGGLKKQLEIRDHEDLSKGSCDILPETILPES
jgi:hypothetical protein